MSNTEIRESNLLWKCGKFTIAIDKEPVIMGILNVTPDSFSDGGMYYDTDRAVKRAVEMFVNGARIIDVGGESTRPGAEPVDVEEEKRRVIPIIKEISSEPDLIVSVDTMKSQVAEAAIEAGASIVNDVSAMRYDNNMSRVVAQSGAGVILMHMKGTPKTMQNNPCYDDVLSEVKDYLFSRIEFALECGIPYDAIAIDPGIGFGKKLNHNLTLIHNIQQFAELGRPVVIGLSRKRWIGEITGREVNERLSGTIAGVIYCYQKGVRIFRVHDVKEIADALKVIRYIECSK